jgi:hypothetical protein
MRHIDGKHVVGLVVTITACRSLLVHQYLYDTGSMSDVTRRPTFICFAGPVRCTVRTHKHTTMRITMRR